MSSSICNRPGYVFGIVCGIVVGLCGTSGGALAGSSIINPGPTMSTGPTANSLSLFGASHNPAASNFLISEGENWRFSYFPNISFGLETGDVSNFADEIDDLIDLLDDPSSNTEPVNDVLDRFNATLIEMGQEGYLTLNNKIYAPLFPIHWRSDLLGGTVSAEASVETQIRLSILDEPLQISPVSGFSTGTSAYIKSGIQKNISLAYSRPLTKLSKTLDLNNSFLFGGARLNFIQLDLSKQVFQLTLLDGMDIEDVVEDEYDNNLISTSAVGLDLGIIWDTPNYTLGLTVSNVNEPTFDYGPIGQNCNQFTAGSVNRSNCEITTYFTQTAGRLKARESHKKHALPTVDGIFKLTESWSVGLTADLAQYNDLTGNDNQWVQFSTAFNSQKRWFPDLRLGYKINQVGSEISTATIGATLFNVITFDLEYGLQSVEVDGTTAPRNFAFSFGIEERF